MIESRWLRWAGLGLIGAVAALCASFNSGERVALSLGFTTLYRIPLVPLIFAAFVAGMATMFLLGLRHDLRVRRALHDAGFAEPISATPSDGCDAPRLSGRDDRIGLEDREDVILPPSLSEPIERPPP